MYLSPDVSLESYIKGHSSGSALNPLERKNIVFLGVSIPESGFNVSEEARKEIEQAVRSIVRAVLSDPNIWLVSGGHPSIMHIVYEEYENASYPDNLIIFQSDIFQSELFEVSEYTTLLKDRIIWTRGSKINKSITKEDKRVIKHIKEESLKYMRYRMFAFIRNNMEKAIAFFLSGQKKGMTDERHAIKKINDKIQNEDEKIAVYTFPDLLGYSRKLPATPVQLHQMVTEEPITDELLITEIMSEHF